MLVNLRTNRIFSLNSPAARFWELLADGNDRDAIVRTMADEFAVGEDEVRGEVASLVESLAAEQLVAPRAGA